MAAPAPLHPLYPFTRFCCNVRSPPMPPLLKHIPQGFSIEIANELANLIVAAYGQFTTSDGGTRKWSLSRPYELIAPFSARLAFRDTETFGFVARRSDTGDVYVVFRGTETPEDWLVNVAVSQVAQQHAWGLVEHGFASVYNQCSSTILDAIRKVSPQRVIVTGHSLGGALATLGASDIRAALGQAPVVYTFASPRLGDPTFAERYNAECPDTWRVVNTEDLITNVPPSTSAMEVRQQGFLDSLLHILDRLPLLSSWVQHRLGWTKAWRSDDVYEHIGTPVSFTRNSGTIMDNHGMATYLAAIGAPRPMGSDSIDRELQAIDRR